MPYVVQYNPQGLGSRSDYETRGKLRYLEDISPKWRLMSDASKSPLEGHGKKRICTRRYPPRTLTVLSSSLQDIQSVKH